MLGVECVQVGKRYKSSWLFQGINLKVAAGACVAVLGQNGAGKSTLLKIIASHTRPTVGSVRYLPIVDTDTVYQRISWMGPSIELYPAFTVYEAFRFHFQLKACLLPSIEDCLSRIELYPHRNKALRELSSGMLQKVRLALAIFSTSEILLLDEPTTFMDTNNAKLVVQLLIEFQQNRTVIIASNTPREYEHLTEFINLNEYI